MKKIEITIPNELRDITLEQYQQVSNLDLEKEDTPVKMLSILCSVPESVILKLSVDDFNKISEIVTTTINKTAHFISKFEINGVKYGFIPNLDEISIGEYIDLDTFIREENDLHKVMSILYRPIIQESFGKYRIEEYKPDSEKDDIMLRAPLDAVRGSMVFFYNLGNELLKHIPQYLEEQVKDNIQFKQILDKNGVGIQVYIDSLMKDLRILEKSQREIYMKHLRS